MKNSEWAWLTDIELHRKYPKLAMLAEMISKELIQKGIDPDREEIEVTASTIFGFALKGGPASQGCNGTTGSHYVAEGCNGTTGSTIAE